MLKDGPALRRSGKGCTIWVGAKGETCRWMSALPLATPIGARAYGAELIGWAPDVILANSSFVVAALKQQTKTIPIVFAKVVDPVNSGFVDSLARPGGT